MQTGRHRCWVYRPKQLVIVVSPENDGAAELVMAGAPGRTYRIDVSDNLLEWSELTVVVATPTGIIEILDIEAKNQPQRFYRAVEL